MANLKKSLTYIFVFSALILFPALASAAPLKVLSSNPRYFTDGTGKAVYLTGSHTWSNLKDVDDMTDPVTPFDFNAYLNFLQDHNHNFIRGWTWELSKYSYTEGIFYSSPFPWPRTGPGIALDGKSKFDLSGFDQAYFDRIRSEAIAARDRGLYVSIMFFEGHGIQRSLAPWRWDGHPFNVSNNINGIDGDPNRDGFGLETHTLQIPAVTAIQEAYMRKLTDTVNDLDNVLYEVANEDGGGSTEWHYYMINFIKNYEAAKPKKHPVGMTYRYEGGTNDELFSSPADWISPNPSAGNYDYRDDPPPASGSKVIISDTDHLWGIGGDRTWVWKSFTRGLNPIFMDPIRSITGTVNPEPPNVENTRYAMGHTLTYADKMNLAAMTPRGDLTSTGYALANPGSEYLVYAPDGGTFSVNLPAGTYSYEWFNASAGSVAQTGSVSAGGGNQSFSPPFSGDAVLYLKSGGGTPTAPTLTFSANPSTIQSGQSSTLTWSSTNATSCSAGGGWSGTKSTSGSQSVSPTVTTSYAMTCTGSGGSVTKSLTVTVGTPTAYTVSQSVSNGQTLSGTVTWTAVPSSISATDRIEFFADGTLRETQFSDPYEIDLNTTTLANGSHALSVKAYSTSGQTATQTANVTISNGTTATKKGDLNNDTKVDVTDLGILLSNWGKTTKPPADLNQDGKVDVIDLGILLSNWG